MGQHRPKILYVLGLAYSGSTLFGLSLGRHSKILNLGEVVNLENDYSPLTRCTCGTTLEQCSFWNELKSNIQSDQADLPTAIRWNLSESGKRSFLERKSDKSRIRMLLGATASQVYDPPEIENYKSKNEAFFQSVSRSLPNVELTVDLSKSSERLQILSECKQLDVWAPYLKRNPVSILHSNLKRPKKTRAGWGPNLVREAILQRQRTRMCETAIRQFPAERKFIVSYEDFTENPNRTINAILNRIEIATEPVNYSSAFDLSQSGQHVFVGNRWLFAEDLTEIQIKNAGTPPKLSLLQRQVLKLALGRQAMTAAHGPAVSI